MPNAPRSSRWRQRWRAFRLHPVFPLVCLLFFTQLVRDDFYPFSHYPMYSRPSKGELSFSYVADAAGHPIPVKEETGLTFSKIGKKYRSESLDRIQALEAGTGRKFSDLPENSRKPILKEAALATLGFVREQSFKRHAAGDLTGTLRLMEINLRLQGGKFTETETLLAELPALP